MRSERLRSLPRTMFAVSAFGVLATLTAFQAPADDVLPILPGAHRGFGMETPAGSGRHLDAPETRAIKVTNLNPEGPGSLREALEAAGPRVAVFEVSGNIDFTLLGQISIRHPYLTVAGQTAPSPGITLKGCQLDVRTHTTSVTFAGKYPGWSVQELLTHGKNKDHRPDLKQLVLGLLVTGDGAVPLFHRVYSGNQTDDRLHPANHKALQKLLGRVDFIYVADCKLATEENLRKIAAWNGLFVSVMPGTWSEDQQFREKVKRKEIHWKHILSRKNNRKPDSKTDRYYVAKGDYKTSQGYRLHWIRSTQKAEQDAATRSRQLERALEDLRCIQTKLNTYHLKTRKQIAQRIQSILEDARYETRIQYEIHATREYKHVYQKKGRPAKDAPKKVAWKEIFSISFGIDAVAVDDEKKVDGVFPLITNLDPKTHAARKVLDIYKFQPFLEKRFSQMKTYHEIAPMYLKKDERVVAYLHMHVMALMVAALIERTLRHAMRRKKLASIPIYPESRPCPAPTIFDIVRLFRNVERHEVKAGQETIVFPAELTDTQKQVLELLEVPVAGYQ